MGNNLFGANISGKIAKAFKGKIPVYTLTRVTPGTRDPLNLAAGTEPTVTTHTFSGVRIGMTSLRKDTILPDAKDAVLILADSLSPNAIPIENDRVLLGSTELTIINVDTDPDEATYTCQVK